MKKSSKIALIAIICVSLFFALVSCDNLGTSGNPPTVGNGSSNPQTTPEPSDSGSSMDENAQGGENSPFPAEPIQIPDFPIPEASGQNVRNNDRAEIDYSHTNYGYVMVRFLEDTDMQLRAQITNPSETVYTYVIRVPGEFEVFPLTGGNGEYTIGIFEQIEGNRYSPVLTHTINVTLVDEFAPFLRPNQFVYFNRDSNAVAVAAGLVHGVEGFLERVGAIYNFVVTHIEYDFELAATVQTGYLPDLDAVLARGLGICFDYAALMAAMLRSIGIPTQLVIGDVGGVRHAWISVYSEEHGWIHNAILFDGNEWNLMDPTFTSVGGVENPAVRDFVGDGENHIPLFTY